jgi:Fur family iron response transcriptional regulator
MTQPPPGPPPPLLLVHGEEPHLVDAEARGWLEAARAQCSSDLNVEVIDTPAKLDQVRRSLSEMPFLDPVRYLMVRDAPQLTERSRRGTEPAELLVTALEQRSETTVVCLVAHAKVPATNAVLVAVRTLGGRISYHGPIKGRDLRTWLDDRLRQAGLRPTRQRLALARLLLDRGDRHVTAEQLHGEALAAEMRVSLATVYNTLHQFTTAGLLREVVVAPGRSYFDTNVDDHHHFFYEGTGRLEDIPGHQVVLSGLPQPPQGTEIRRVDVIIRVQSPSDRQ